MSDNVYVNLRGASAPTLLAAWVHGRTGVYGELHQRANRSAQILTAFDAKRTTILGDQRLTELAKKADIHAAGLDAVRALGLSQSLLNGIAERVAEEQGEVIAVEPYKPNDFATVAIDLALAAHIRQMEPAQLAATLAMGSDSRLLEAVVRLPGALTGVSEAARQQAITDAIYRKDPMRAQESQATAEAISTANGAHDRAYKILQQEAGLTTSEVRSAVGEATSGQSDSGSTATA